MENKKLNNLLRIYKNKWDFKTNIQSNVEFGFNNPKNIFKIN